MMEKPRTFNGDLAHLSTALQPLTGEPRWMVWSWEWRTTNSGKGKWTKPPRQARDPKYNARSNDPSTWGTYDDALAAVQRGNADGIGYALLGSGIGAIDLDHVLDERRSTDAMGVPNLHRSKWRLSRNDRKRGGPTHHRHDRWPGNPPQVHL